jgi:uncharacterized protein (DUF2141 family)
MKKFIVFAALCLSAFAYELEIDFTNIKADRGGNIIVAICDKEQPFPCNKDSAYKTVRLKVVSNTAKYNFELPQGTYAVVAGHDENDNHKVDKNFFGIPIEGYAISGQSVTIPKFESAKFNLTNNLKINMPMKY